eukprot:6207403-Pleurochrysis_carterae.AAC.6
MQKRLESQRRAAKYERDIKVNRTRKKAQKTTIVNSNTTLHSFLARDEKEFRRAKFVDGLAFDTLLKIYVEADSECGDAPFSSLRWLDKRARRTARKIIVMERLRNDIKFLGSKANFPVRTTKFGEGNAIATVLISHIEDEYEFRIRSAETMRRWLTAKVFFKLQADDAANHSVRRASMGVERAA